MRKAIKTPKGEQKSMSKAIQKGKIHYGETWFGNGREFWLDHQCDSWIIGEIEEAKKFAKDLLALIKEVENG